MHSLAPFLSARPERRVRLGQTPLFAPRSAATSTEVSSVIARALQPRSTSNRAGAPVVRLVGVAFAWILIGISCAELFSAFHGD